MTDFKEAMDLCETLHLHGYKAYMVGGCVRDMLLGKNPKDYDIATNAKPEKVMSIFPNNVPTGLKHGTVTVVGKTNIEVTTFRKESNYDGRSPETVEFVDDLEEDLARRDFTINAIALDPIRGGIIDPYDGGKDIIKKIIRCVGDPNERFKEDALRVFRAIRFVSQLGFVLEDSTFQGVKENYKQLKNISMERRRDELVKLLNGEFVVPGLLLMFFSGVLSTFDYPSLEDIYLWAERIKACENKLMMFFLPFSLEGPIKKDELVNKFKLSEKEAKLISKTLNFHMDFPLTRKILIDALIKEGREVITEYIKLRIVIMNKYFESNALLSSVLNSEVPLSLKELNVNGDDLISTLGVKGKELGKLLIDLLYWASEEPGRNWKEFLLMKAKELHNSKDDLV